MDSGITIVENSSCAGAKEMANAKIHKCQCGDCRKGADQSLKEMHRRMNVFLSRLDEQQRRWYVALESEKIGHSGDRLLSRIRGRNVATIRPGRRALGSGQLVPGRPDGEVRADVPRNAFDLEKRCLNRNIIDWRLRRRNG